jgi:TolB-like protein
VLAVAFMAIDNYWLMPAGSVLPAKQGGSIGRIAVLPCDNLSPDPNNSYFAPGIHDELLNRLAQIRGLPVISRS